MARLDILGAPYAGRSLIASAQRAVNWYAESNKPDPQAPVQLTHYQTPGSALYADTGVARSTRMTYRTSMGTAYIVVGTSVFFLDVNQTLSIVGFIADRTSQVYAADNGLVCVLTDGLNGYVIDMASNQFGQIIDPNFYPADFVVFLDTFFCFNRAGTDQFFISASIANYGMLTNTAVATGTIAGGAAYTNGNYSGVALQGGSGTGATAEITIAGGAVTVVGIDDGGQNYLIGDVLTVLAADVGGTGAGFTYTVTGFASAFDPLDIAAKSGSADPIIGLTTTHQELNLIGALTSEVWIGTGAADFFFQQQQGAYIDHGCGAQYSLATIDILTFFIAQDKQGSGLVLQLSNYQVQEISTPRIVEIIKQGVFSDAIGFTFQISDHAFYVLILPTQNLTLMYDLTTGFWNEWAWTDENGNLNRHRANCGMFVYGENIVGDWETGKLLKLKSDLYQDEGQPIVRIRTMPHVVNGEFSRISGKAFDADVSVGDAGANDDEPMIDLLWSDNRGKSYGNPVTQSLGKEGQYLTTVSWNRLGQARDRVYMLRTAANVRCVLNGAFIDNVAART